MNKILFILHYPPPVHGAAMVGQYIRESGHINRMFECQYINLGTSTSIDEIGKGGWLKWKRYFNILVNTFRSLYQFKPKLVYLTLTASGSGFYKDALVALLVKAYGKKVIYHFHNKGVKSQQDKWLNNALYTLVFRNAKVILLSEYLYPDIEKYVPKDSVYYCANGIPENDTITPKGKNLKDKVQLLFLSNLIVSKGVFVLMETCQLLHQKSLPFHCTFIGGEGDITAKQFQEKVTEMGIDNCVNYAGKKYGIEKEQAYAQTDIFVHPTLNDCFPLVLVEAMQFSLPIVSTFVGGIPDIVKYGNTGYLVQQQDVIALADKLETLIINPELRKKMGEAGRKRYKEQFTLELFETRFSNIIKELV